MHQEILYIICLIYYSDYYYLVCQCNSIQELLLLLFYVWILLLFVRFIILVIMSVPIALH